MKIYIYCPKQNEQTNQHRKNVSKVIDKLLMNRTSINHLYAQNIMKNAHRNINKQQYLLLRLNIYTDHHGNN